MDQTENNNENRIAQEGKRDNANETGRILKDDELNTVTGGDDSNNLYSKAEYLRKFGYLNGNVNGNPYCTCKTPQPGDNGVICLACGNVIDTGGFAGKNDSGGGIAPAPK